MPALVRSRRAAAAVAMVLVGALGAACTSSGEQPAPATPRPQADESLAVGSDQPNIVVVMTDDMRFDEVRFMPFTRKLFAENGVRFANSFSNFPLCCPARASFLTGQYAHNHEVWFHKPPFAYGAFDDSRTIGTALQAEGYQTAFIGKYLNKYGQDPSKVSGEPSHTYVPNGWTDWYAGIQNPGNGEVKGGLHAYFKTAMNINGEAVTYPGEYQTNVFGRHARELVQKYHETAAPFYMQINYLAPHKGGPGEPDDPEGVTNSKGKSESVPTPARPRSVRGRFDQDIPRALGKPSTGAGAEKDVSDKQSSFRDEPRLNAEVWRAVRELSRQRAEALYVVDRDLRRTVRTLRRTGEWKNTVLMFTSDNGYYLGEHRQPKGKIHPHEVSFRVPFMVTGPGMRDGSWRPDPVTTVDVTASVLDLAGASAPLPADGRSMVGVMRRGSRGWRNAVLYEQAFAEKPKSSIFGRDDQRRAIGIRTGRYAYIRYNDGFAELYDLVRDPHELRSVARDPRYRAERRALQGVLDEMADCSGEQCEVRLPESLAMGPEGARRLSTDWREAREARYGTAPAGNVGQDSAGAPTGGSPEDAGSSR